MNRLYAILLALTCILSAGPASAALTDPAQIQTEAYVNLVQADQGFDAGRLNEALSLYQAARDYYRQLADEFPGWEPRIVQYRKTYCDNQITDIERRQNRAMPDEPPELPALAAAPPATATETAPAPAPAPVAPVAPQPVPDRSVEISYLKSRIASLEAELAEFDVLQNERDALTAESERLRAALDTANRQLAERTAGDQTETRKLHEELAAKDAELQSLRKNLESKKQLDQALNDMEAKVNELRTQHNRLTEEIKTLDQELDDAEIRADQAELRAAKAEKDLKKTRTDMSRTEKKLAAARRKADGKPGRKTKDPPQPEKPAEPEVPVASGPAPVFAPPQASVPPRPVPAGMSAVNYVRQLLQDGENEAALATVQEARRNQPADRNLLLIEGITLTLLQRYTEAATLLNDLAKHNPRNGEIHGALGGAMMGAGFYDEARETLLMAVDLDDDLPECHYNLALLYAFIDPVNHKLARRHYQQALELGVAADPRLDKALN